MSAKPLWAFFGDLFLVGANPSDPVYRQRQAADMIDGFRVLSLTVCASTAAMFLVHIVHAQSALTLHSRDALSLITFAVLALAGAIALWVSKWIRSSDVALLTAAALLVATVAALTVDRWSQLSLNSVPAPLLIPEIFPVLMLGTTLMALRPARVLALGILLLLACFISAASMGARLGFVDLAGACVAIAISAAVSARSTSQRIRIHDAHLAAIEAARQTEEAHSRALLAESAITMEHLAASLSHELNTPIGALKSATDTLTRGVQRYATFPTNSRMPELVEELGGTIRQSTARFVETVARIQRFANLDRSGIRLTDINQLVQDAVALMNPPSVGQAQVALNLNALPQVWCMPHRLSMALAPVLNTVVERGYGVTIDTRAMDDNVILTMTVAGEDEWLGENEDLELGFGVVADRVRVTGWDLFAARQLVRETGGDLVSEHTGPGKQTISITIPTSALVPRRDFDGATTSAASTADTRIR